MEDGQSNSPEWRRQREEQLAEIIRELEVEASRRVLETVEYQGSSERPEVQESRKTIGRIAHRLISNQLNRKPLNRDSTSLFEERVRQLDYTEAVIKITGGSSV